MPRRILKLVSKGMSRAPAAHAPAFTFSTGDIVWVMGSFSALNRKPFDAELLVKQFPPPYSADSFIHAARALGFRIKRRDCDSAAVLKLSLPCLAILNEPEASGDTAAESANDTVAAAEAAANAIRQAASPESPAPKRYWRLPKADRRDLAPDG